MRFVEEMDFLVFGVEVARGWLSPGKARAKRVENSNKRDTEWAPKKEIIETFNDTI